MRLILPSIEFLHMTTRPLETIERASRTCYKSEDRITPGSAAIFVLQLLDREHFAMIEHAHASYRVICDRGVTHEIVRHRLFSYAQESTRYCNYKSGVTFIIPCWFPESVGEGEYKTSWNSVSGKVDIESYCNRISNQADTWFAAMASAELRYKYLIESGWTPQQARSVLPNSLKTEIVITGNLREWLHFLTLRTATTAHPQMQEVAKMLLVDMQKRVPVLFD